MNKIDWQAFDDGSLSPEEMIAIKQAMRSDPSLKAEWEGFLALKLEIKNTREKESVPHERLSAMLDRVVAPMPSRLDKKRAWSLAGMAAAVGAVAFIAARFGGPDQPQSAFSLPPPADNLALNDLSSGVEWIERHTQLHVPAMKLPMEAKPIKATYGRTECWACLDFEYNGHTFCLLITARKGLMKDCKPKTFEGIVYFEGDGIGWQCEKLSYYLQGGTEAERWKFATHLAPQTLGKVL